MYKNIIITGASDGIGFELCLLFAKNKARIYANGRNKEKLESLKEKCNNLGAEVEIFSGDVRNRESMLKWIENIFSTNKNIDLVIANAGISRADSSLKSELSVIDINIVGVVNTIFPAIELLKKRGIKSHIAITGSIAGYFVMPNSYSYSSSKVFCNALSEGLYLGLKPHNISVSIINPGFVDTKLIQNSSYKTLFILNSNQAAKIIFKGLLKKKRIITFPLIVALLAKFYNIMPIFIKNSLQNLLPKGL